MATIKRSHSYERLEFAVNCEFIGTASSSIDNKLEIEGIKDQLTELTGLMKDHKMNAAYNPHKHKNKQNNPTLCNWYCMSGHTINHCFKSNNHQEQNYELLQIRENANRNSHKESCSSKVDNNFNDIDLQQEFRHMSNCNESSQSLDKSKNKTIFNRNNDYISPYQINNFSDDDIPENYNDKECELGNLN